MLIINVNTIIMDKPIMNIFKEKPLKSWMKLYAFFKFGKRNMKSIIDERRYNNKTEFELMIKKTNRGYVLAEGLWESKKTLQDYLSYLNQYSTEETPIKVHLFNYRPFGNCDFVLDMIGYKRSFKRLDIASLMLKDDNNEWWSITNQLD